MFFLKKTVRNWRKLLSLLALGVLVLFFYGYFRKYENTLVDVMKATGSPKMVSVEQIDVTTRWGPPRPGALLKAKVLRKVTGAVELGSFEKAIAESREGHTYKNHPTLSEDIVLRVRTTDGEWTLFCNVLTQDGPQTSVVKTCVLASGEEGETNISRMNRYESDLLVEWIDQYLKKR